MWQERTEGILWASERLVFCVAKNIEGILWAFGRLVYCVVTKLLKALKWEKLRRSMRPSPPCTTNVTAYIKLQYGFAT